MPSKQLNLIGGSSTSTNTTSSNCGSSNINIVPNFGLAPNSNFAFALHHPNMMLTNPAAPAPSASATAAAPTSSSSATTVDQLVYEIKENLRLKARPTSAAAAAAVAAASASASSAATSSGHHRSGATLARSASRPSPYHIPCRSWAEPANASCDKQQLMFSRRHRFEQQKHSNSAAAASELDADPYELLQTLLKSNSLVKEAVRRLQQLSYAQQQAQQQAPAAMQQTSAGVSTGSGSAGSQCESPPAPRGAFTYYEDSEDGEMMLEGAAGSSSSGGGVEQQQQASEQQQQRLRMCHLEL